MMVVDLYHDRNCWFLQQLNDKVESNIKMYVSLIIVFQIERVVQNDSHCFKTY